MKRAVSILLSALLIFNSLGYVVFYHQVRFQIRSVMRAEIKRGMESQRIQIVKVYFSDIASGKINFRRIEKDEFRLNGQMYDIVKEVKSDGYFTFYCIPDIKESALEALFASLTENNSASGKTSPSQTAIKQLIKEIAPLSSYELSVNPSISDFPSYYSISFFEGIKPQIKHPPDIFSV